MAFAATKRNRVLQSVGTTTMTKQEHKMECDINNILSQFKRTGIINHIANVPPVYGDLPDTVDYQQSLNMLLAADSAFDALPSVVRRYFDNDPAKLLAALSDPAMQDKLTELGILNPKPQPQPAGNPANFVSPAGAPSLPASSSSAPATPAEGS